MTAEALNARTWRRDDFASVWYFIAANPGRFSLAEEASLLRSAGDRTYGRGRTTGAAFGSLIRFAEQMQVSTAGRSPADLWKAVRLYIDRYADNVEVSDDDPRLGTERPVELSFASFGEQIGKRIDALTARMSREGAAALMKAFGDYAFPAVGPWPPSAPAMIERLRDVAAATGLADLTGVADADVWPTFRPIADAAAGGRSPNLDDPATRAILEILAALDRGDEALGQAD